MIIRVHKWILGFIQAIPHTIPIESELRAFIRGIEVARNHSLFPLEINTDFQAILNMLKNGNERYDNFVCQCKHLMDTLDQVMLRHVFREQNQVVDTLAKE